MTFSKLGGKNMVFWLIKHRVDITEIFNLTFDKNSVKSTDLLKKLFKSYFHEKIYQRVNFPKKKSLVSHSVKSTTTVSQCGNYGILVSHFFGKNFVKATVLLNKSLKS